MLFSTPVFIFVFLPATYLVYLIGRRFSLDAAIVWLVLASLFFYSWWNVFYAPLLIFSISANYMCYRLGDRINDTRLKRLVYSIGIFLNIGLIAYYKYIGFLANDVFGHFFSGVESPILPLAISFFTFQQISFLVDHYKNRDLEHTRFLDYACYVTFFPQLIAGPIVRHNELIPQLKTVTPSTTGLLVGFMVFSFGLAKKVLVADGLSSWVAIGFAPGGATNLSDAWLATLSYTFQLYFDFSGYSDMAIGLGLMFGLTLPQNFNAPYRSLSIQDFWRRWHMTLSSWLRDYVYIWLGGNRAGKLRTYLNLLLTMLIGGIWHGAGWTFVVWGLIHGIALMINRLWSRLSIPVPTIVAWGITFMVVINAWVVFRAPDFGTAMNIYSGMYQFDFEALPASWVGGLSDLLTGLGLSGGEIPAGVVQTALPLHAWLVMIALLGFCLFGATVYDLMTEVLKGTRTMRDLILFFTAGALFLWATKRMMEVAAPTEFLYFQF